MSRLEQREPRHQVWPTLTLDECEHLLAENETGYRAFLEQYDEEQASAVIHYRTSTGLDFASTADEILTQVITHGPYHRGQIAKIIGRHGGTVLNTDFIMFVREKGSV